MADETMTPIDWIEFGVRAAAALGQTVGELIAAMRAGDLDTTHALAARLPPGDRIVARVQALKVREAAIAAAAAQEEADAMAEDTPTRPSIPAASLPRVPATDPAPAPETTVDAAPEDEPPEDAA